MVSPTLEVVLASLLRERQGTSESLAQRFCTSCLEMLDVSGVALTLTGTNGHHLVVASSNHEAKELAELESALGEGPGTQARSTGGPVLVRDLRSADTSSRWPAYAAATDATPARAQFSYPLHIGVIRLGVLMLYREAPGPFTEEDATCALVLADVATVLLLHLQDVTDGEGELHLELASAFTETAELHQATGMVSIQADVGLKEALLLLHARAYSTGRTSLEVAHDVLAGEMNFRQNDES